MSMTDSLRLGLLLALSALYFTAMAQAQGLARGSAQDLAVEQVEHYGYIDWTNMRAVATGMGVPPANAASMGQWRAMAERASVVDARRNLLEVVKGVHIDSTTTVRNFATESDVIVSRISGVLTAAVVVETTQQADGSFVSVVSMPLDGDLGRELFILVPPRETEAAPEEFASEAFTEEPLEEQAALEPESVEVLEEPAAEEPAPLPVPLPVAEEAADPFTGLVIDARNLGFRPSMRPEVHGPVGLLYPGPNMDADAAAGRGFVRYYQDPDQARQSAVTGENPLTVTAQGLYQDNESALTLSDADAASLEEIMAQPGNFLDSGSVVIVF